MIRVKHPIEYELTPDAVERGSHWLTVRIKNTGDNDRERIVRYGPDRIGNLSGDRRRHFLLSTYL